MPSSSSYVTHLPRWPALAAAFLAAAACGPATAGIILQNEAAWVVTLAAIDWWDGYYRGVGDRQDKSTPLGYVGPFDGTVGVDVAGHGAAIQATAAENFSVIQDPAADSLSLTGSGSGSISITKPADGVWNLTSAYTDSEFRLYFTLTDRPYSYSFSASVSGDQGGTTPLPWLVPKPQVAANLVSSETIHSAYVIGAGTQSSEGTGILQPGLYGLDAWGYIDSGNTWEPFDAWGSFNYSVALTLVPAAQETTYRWTDPAGGVWTVGSNWDRGAAPPADANTLFDLGGAYAVTGYTGSVNSMRVAGGDVTLAGPGQLALTEPAHDKYALAVDGGELIVRAGNLTAHESVVGDALSGAMTVSGGSWSNQGDLYVGKNALGTLTVTDGAGVQTGGLVFIGNESEGHLDIANAATFSNSLGVLAGLLPGSTGGLTVRGDGSALTNRGVSAHLVIGEGGTGSLELLDGGWALTGATILGDEADSRGTVRVSGAGSWLGVDPGKHLSVGYRGSGALVVEDRGLVSSPWTELGKLAGSTGEVLVSGAGAKLEAGVLTLAKEGNGALFIEDGARVEADAVTLVDWIGNPTANWTVVNQDYAQNFATRSGLHTPGADPRAYLVVSGRGSELAVHSFTEVGKYGAGFAIVENGGVATSGDTDVHNRSFLWVDGAGSRWDAVNDSGELEVLGSEYAAFLVSNGAEATSRTARLGSTAGGVGLGLVGYGVVTGADSKWTVHDSLALHGLGSLLDVNAGGVVEVGGELSVAGTAFFAPSQLRVGADSTVYANTLTIDQYGRVADDGLIVAPTVNVLGGGSLEGTGRVQGSVNNYGGNVAPGFSPGILTIDGDYLQGPDGILDIEIAGIVPGNQYDVLQILGDALLEGTLTLGFNGGFVPSIGDTFDFMRVDGQLTGGFDEVVVRGLLPGFVYDLLYGDGRVSLVARTDGTPVPEPATCLLFAAGLFALAQRRKPRSPAR